MKKFYLIAFIIIVVIIAGYLIINKQNEIDKTNIFAPLLSKQFSEDLSLEEGYNIVLPYVHDWASDALLTTYSTNIPDSSQNYKSNLYTFDSISSKKTIIICYNCKPISSNNTLDLVFEFDKTANKELNKTFSIKEIYWPTNDNEGEDLYKNTVLDYHINNINNYVSSDRIIEIAKKEGLTDFINNHKNYNSNTNRVALQYSHLEALEWVIFYEVIDELNNKSGVFTFVANAETGEIKNKRVK
jgi:hypothetical protein